MLCERCQERDARVFLTQIICGKSTQSNLCEACYTAMAGEGLPVSPESFPSSSISLEQVLSRRGAPRRSSSIPPSAGMELPSLLGGPCFYCGGEANSGMLNDSWEFAVRQQRFHYTCRRCGEMCNEFMMEALAPFPNDLPRDEQLRRLEEIVREVDARVRASLGDAG